MQECTLQVLRLHCNLGVDELMRVACFVQNPVFLIQNGVLHMNMFCASDFVGLLAESFLGD